MNIIIENLVQVGKSAEGQESIKAFIDSVLNHDEVYYFTEFLQMKNIQAYEEELSLLKLFAYGTFQDYIANKQAYIELNQILTEKLRLLTLISLCNKQKTVLYDQIKEATLLNEDDQIEDLIIMGFNKNLLTGHIDQEKHFLKVFTCISRDISPNGQEVQQKLRTILKKVQDTKLQVM